MPCIEYRKQRFSASSQVLIDHANTIIAEYLEQGFKLTLRQLYYQFVSRDLIPNTVKSYKRLGSIVNDARLAGLIDWDAIEDRTRAVVSPPHWETPADIIDAAARSFRIDKWEDQDYRPEVWIEKEALAGVIEGVCRELDIPFLSCRGYTSQSEMWSSAMRLGKLAQDHGQTPIIFHFGDHDPSGMDMTRDICDRLEMFGCGMEVKRLALNMPQVREYHPPPNPAKTTDARFRGYMIKYGDESWELDALEPRILTELIRVNVVALLNTAKWTAKVEEEKEHRRKLAAASAQWEEIEENL